MHTLALFLASITLASALTNPPKSIVPAPGLGDGLWRTFSDALNGDAPKVPMSLAELQAAGWTQQDPSCDDNLGILYTYEPTGMTKDHPLGVYVTESGQIAGLAVTIWGEAWTSGVGPAAQPELVRDGFWIVAGADQWYMSVSFRDPQYMCGKNNKSPLTIGDRVVINQGTLDWYMPATAKDATDQGFQPGSCMRTMGQHHFLDLASAPAMSWKAKNLLPVVPMYWPVGDPSGTLSTIFFTTPVVQKGSYLLGTADWETPFLPDVAMCENWCNTECHWDTEAWSTMHIYFNSGWATWECPAPQLVGLGALVGRSCPSGVLGSYQWKFPSLSSANHPVADAIKAWTGLDAETGDEIAGVSNMNHSNVVPILMGVSLGVIVLVGIAMAVRSRLLKRDSFIELQEQRQPLP